MSSPATSEPAPAAAARIALGTVQFGLDYGVSNRAGRPTAGAIGDILAHARRSGCDTLDTAMAYGDSESRLGAAGVGEWHVVTKIPGFPAGTADLREWCRDSVLASLGRLRVAQVHGLLLHDPAPLNGPRGRELFDALQAVQDAGLVRKLGVSIYSPDELEALQAYPLEIVQAPLNPVDRRLLASGWGQRLAERGIEVHLRSIFLQGLLLMDDATRPPYFGPWSATWRTWREWLHEAGVTALQACVRFALAQPFAAKVVVGVTSLAEFKGILEAAQGRLAALPESLASADARLVNPSLWKLE